MSYTATRILIPPPDQNTIWEDKDYGIRAVSEFERYINQSVFEKVWGYGSTNLKAVEYTFSSGFKSISSKLHQIRYPEFSDDTPIGKANSSGLITFFHGLNGQPFAWDEYIHYLRSFDNLNVDIFAPTVPNKGQCSVNCEESYKLLDRITDWTKQNPHKPIGLFGHSNGARFPVRFETWLRKAAPKAPIHESLSGAALYGSKTLETAVNVFGSELVPKISFGFVGPEATDELYFGSETEKSLLSDAREPLEEGVAERESVFYASVHDHHIGHYGSSLPIFNVNNSQKSKRERHYIVTGLGHNASVNAFMKERIDECLQFMNVI